MTQASPPLPLIARGLSKRFGKVQAVSNVDLDVAPGQALGLLGPNGAGKSTTLSMLMGLRAPDAGTASIFGHPAGSAAARRLTGATPQNTGFPDQLTPRELLTYTAARYGTAPQIDRLVDHFGLQTLIDRKVAGFSGGEMRRVALALAFVGAPRLVFLDEPTTGLDIAAQEGFRAVARTYVEDGGTLVLTSHHWDEIEAVCDAIALIDKGERVMRAQIGDMRRRAAVNRLSFDLPPGALPPEWMQARHDGARWHVETTEADETLRRMVRDDMPFAHLAVAQLELKDLIDRIRQEETAQ